MFSSASESTHFGHYDLRFLSGRWPYQMLCSFCQKHILLYTRAMKSFLERKDLIPCLPQFSLSREVHSTTWVSGQRTVLMHIFLAGSLMDGACKEMSCSAGL